MAKITVRICGWCGKREGPGKPPVIPSTITWQSCRDANAQMACPASKYFHLVCIQKARMAIRYAADTA